MFTPRLHGSAFVKKMFTTSAAWMRRTRLDLALETKLPLKARPYLLNFYQLTSFDYIE